MLMGSLEGCAGLPDGRTKARTSVRRTAGFPSSSSSSSRFRRPRGLWISTREYISCQTSLCTSTPSTTTIIQIPTSTQPNSSSALPETKYALLHLPTLQHRVLVLCRPARRRLLQRNLPTLWPHDWSTRSTARDVVPSRLPRRSLPSCVRATSSVDRLRSSPGLTSSSSSLPPKCSAPVSSPSPTSGFASTKPKTCWMSPSWRQDMVSPLSARPFRLGQC